MIRKPKDKTKRRFTAYAIFVGIIAAVFIWRLFMMQLVDGEYYLKLAEQKQRSNVVIKAPRGEILDRYGRPLVANKVGYSLHIQKTTLNNSELNDTLRRLYRLVESEGSEVLETFPISLNEPFEFTFSEQYAEDKAYAAELDWKDKSACNLKDDSSPVEVIEKYRERYKISKDYSLEDQRRIVGMRYAMELCGFSVTAPYVAAIDVNMSLITKIKEERQDYLCVNVVNDYVREYKQGSIAAHILGRVAIISPKEYEDKRGLGYKMTDYLGKEGIEFEYESKLRGTDGYSSLRETSEGFVSQTDGAQDPIPGDFVVLTIDSKLQTTLEDALGRTIEDIRTRGGDPSEKSGGDAYCGAAVVIDIHTGEILAMATWPTFDPSEYSSKYNELAADPNTPMWNRAISGMYPPGSSFKMLVSIAALETGTIQTDTVIKDEGVYTLYQGYQPACWLWRRNQTTHGNQTVTTALANSCNYFYYEVGRELGIDVINDYARRFGFGEKTGIELKRDEERGRIAGPEDRQKYGGEPWTGGDVLQAAIGQSDNLFTPLQLASYVATLVNGGIRYEPHIVKTVRSSVDSSNISDTVPTILETIPMQQENIDAVLEGMLGVTENGTAASAFSGYEIKVGGKTGSAQVNIGSDNGVFVGFAPYDKPEIAIAVVIEHGNSGSDLVPVVKAVFDAYFLAGEHESDINNITGELLP